MRRRWGPTEEAGHEVSNSKFGIVVVALSADYRRHIVSAPLHSAKG
jgi:hypothetical protein